MNKKIWISALAFSLFSFPAFGLETLCSFEGTISFPAKESRLVLSFPNGSALKAYFQAADARIWNWQLELVHWRTSGMDISTVVDGSLIWEPSSGSLLEGQGRLRSQYSLLNYQPTPEFSGKFQIRDNKMLLDDFSWGGFWVDGSLGLNTPYDLDVQVHFDGVRSQDILLAMPCSSSLLESLGVFSGQLRFLGTWERPILQGNLKILDGVIENVAFENMLIHFEGQYPRLHIDNSHLREKNGLDYQVEGIFAFEKGLCPADNNLAHLNISPVVDQHLTTTEWTIKRSQDDEASAATELKYRVRQPEHPLANPEDILGVTQTLKF